MRAIVQRVTNASVSVNNKVVGSIQKGYFVLLGIKQGDTESDVHILVKKISGLRVMADFEDKMNLNLIQSQGSILVVSQFTLYANTKDGNRPSFTQAAEPILAEKLYNLFVSELRDKNLQVETGSFGEYMKIDTKLDGPVTIIFDTKND